MKSLAVIEEERKDPLCSCERGDGVESIDTESLTLEDTLVSSFSSDCEHYSHQEDETVLMTSGLPSSVRSINLRQRGPLVSSSATNNDVLPRTVSSLQPARHGSRPELRKTSSFIQSSPWDQLKRRKYLISMFLLLGIFNTTLQWRGQRPAKWKIPSRHKKLLQKIHQRPVSDSMTIVLAGSRLDLVKRSLDQHANCKLVQEIQLQWQSPDDFPTSLLQHKSGKVTVSDKKMKTDAVLLLSEGIHYSCRDLELALHEWQLDPTRMVGLIPDSATFVSDRAGLVHKYYLLSAPTLSPRHGECQPWALSAYVTVLSGTTPAVLASRPDFVSNRQREQRFPDKCRRLLKQAAGFDSLPVAGTRFLGRS